MRCTLSLPLTLREIAECTDGRLNTKKNDIIRVITTDSRKVERGDLFIAIKGEHFDGESFSVEAKRRGGYVLSYNHTSSITVNNTTNALLAIAAHYKKRLPNLKKCIAITGSVGKTTTKEFTKVIFSESFKTHATRENENNFIGLPTTILSTPKEAEILIVEMGMNHRGEISLLSNTATPDVAIITNIGSSHIGNLGTKENIALAKLEIVDGMNEGKLLVPYGEKLLCGYRNTITFSTSHDDANYRIRSDDNVMSFFHNRKLLFSVPLHLQASHIPNCLAPAVAAALELGISANIIKKRIPCISLYNTRQKIIDCEKFHIFDDSYNSSSESIRAALDTLSNFNGYSTKSALLGSILELGNHAKSIHEAIGELAGSYDLDSLYLFGEFADDMRRGAMSAGFSEEKIFINEDVDFPELTAKQIREHTKHGEIILFKASRGVRLERIIDLLQQRRT